MNFLVATLIGFGGGLGLLMLIQGVRGYQLLPDLDKDAAGDGAETIVWVFAGLLAGLVILVVTGWIVLAVATFGFIAFLPRLRDDAEAKHDIEKTKAIASWTEMVRDNMAGAAGLEQAIILAAEYAPSEIHSEVSLFVRSLDHTSLEEALPRLGDALDNPAADMVIVSLTNAARMQSSDLGPLLSRLASTTRDDVRLRQRVGIEASKIKTSARIVGVITASVAVLLWLINPKLVEAYDSFQGQLMLTLILMVFAGGGWAIRRYAKPEKVDRFTARRRVAL